MTLPRPRTADAGYARGNGPNLAGSRSTPIEYDKVLFEELRALRRRLADVRDVPAFVIFGDVSHRLALGVPGGHLEALPSTYSHERWQIHSTGRQVLGHTHPSRVASEAFAQASLLRRGPHSAAGLTRQEPIHRCCRAHLAKLEPVGRRSADLFSDRPKMGGL